MKELETDALLSYIKGEFNKFKDDRADNSSYTMGDILQSSLAIFSLKDSSLLDYNSQVSSRVDNLRRIYKIQKNPSDTQMRTVLDKVAPIQIERVKKRVLQKVKKQVYWRSLNILKTGNYC